MGLGPRISRSTYDTGPGSFYIPRAPNPNPAKFVIRESQMVRGHVVLLVNYPDATSYEGNKILLYKDTKLSDIRRQKTLDPHFSNSRDFLSPFARFEPTNAGWNAAVWLAENLE